MYIMCVCIYIYIYIYIYTHTHISKGRDKRGRRRSAATPPMNFRGETWAKCGNTCALKAAHGKM